MKVDRHLIQELNALIRKRGIDVLELTTREGSLRLERAAPGPADSSPSSASPSATSHSTPTPYDGPVKPAHSHEITAPMSAIYLDRHPFHDQPLAEPGRSIDARQLIGFLKVGCLLMPLRSSHAGRVASMLVRTGDTVDYGKVIMRLETDARI